MTISIIDPDSPHAKQINMPLSLSISQAGVFTL
jgi:hypothetical protein